MRTATTRKPACSPSRIPPLFLIFCLALIPAFIPPVQASDQHKVDHALIFGTVWGPDDRPVAGVKIKIRRANETKARWEVYSNRRGEFEQQLPVGQQAYVVWADLKGYKSLNGKQLRPGNQVTVRIENNERADTGVHLK